jgi:nitrate reductase (cytochrome), electron transfer subunit
LRPQRAGRLPKRCRPHDFIAYFIRGDPIMKMTLKLSLLAALATVIAACATSVVDVTTLRGSSVSAPDAAPTEKAYLGKSPGQLVLIERNFQGQPPLIPHAIDKFDITPEANDCLDCHISDELNGKKMPMLPKSHLLAQTKPDAEPELNMHRYQCNSCHVPQVDARPLVENEFKGNGVRKN